MELLKDFPIDKYLSKKPPSQNGNTTKNEVAELTKIPMRKKFIEEKDDIHASFKKIVGNDPIIDKLVEESAPIILKIKKHHDRPRPKVMAKKMNIKMRDVELKSMKTHPAKRKKLKKMGKDISYSRRVARAHYKSDSMFGEQIGKDMYNHIKNKI